LRLPDDPHSPEFWTAYRKLSGTTPEPEASGTFNALIAAYKASLKFRAKGERTRKLNGTHLAIISQAWGQSARPRRSTRIRTNSRGHPAL